MTRKISDSAFFPTSLLIIVFLFLAMTSNADNRLVYTTDDENRRKIRILDLETGESAFITHGRDASWSPDGHALVFYRMDASGSNLYIVEARHEGAVRQLTDSAAHDRGPTWSPDGSMVAFSSDRSGTDQIWRMNIDSGDWGPNLTQLTSDTPHKRVNNFVSWSPDGRWLAFESDRDRDDPEIFLANAVDGTNQQRLTFSRALDEVPSWTPDGRYILFSSDRHDDPLSRNYDIYIMAIDHRNPTRLTNTPGAASYPSMSPDGRYIAFSYRAPGASSTDVMLMNADGSAVRNLISDADMPRFAPSWDH